MGKEKSAKKKPANSVDVTYCIPNCSIQTETGLRIFFRFFFSQLQWSSYAMLATQSILCALFYSLTILSIKSQLAPRFAILNDNWSKWKLQTLVGEKRGNGDTFLVTQTPWIWMHARFLSIPFYGSGIWTTRDVFRDRAERIGAKDFFAFSFSFSRNFPSLRGTISVSCIFINDL